MRPGILRRGRGGGASRQVRFALEPAEEEEEEAAAAAPSSPPPALATPTLHRELGEGPWRGPQEPFDPPRAAAALLGSSFAARSAVGGAAAAAMNLPPSQRLFSGLVSLALPPTPAPRRGAQPRPPIASPTKAPAPDLWGVLRGGWAASSGEGGPWLPPPTPTAPPLEPPRVTPRPPGSTFTLFQKLQQWGGG